MREEFAGKEMLSGSIAGVADVPDRGSSCEHLGAELHENLTCLDGEPRGELGVSFRHRRILAVIGAGKHHRNSDFAHRPATRCGLLLIVRE